MKQFATIALPDGGTTTLAMKVAVASGPARRFIVGDPAIQLIDALAGETVARMAAAEHLANRGEIVVDAQTIFARFESLVQLSPTGSERTVARGHCLFGR